MTPNGTMHIRSVQVYTGTYRYYIFLIILTRANMHQLRCATQQSSLSSILRGTYRLPTIPSHTTGSLAFSLLFLYRSFSTCPSLSLIFFFYAASRMPNEKHASHLRSAVMDKVSPFLVRPSGTHCRWPCVTHRWHWLSFVHIYETLP